LTRNSAAADKPCKAFVEMQWRGWPPKNALPVCFHADFWSFCIKQVGIDLQFLGC